MPFPSGKQKKSKDFKMQHFQFNSKANYCLQHHNVHYKKVSLRLQHLQLAGNQLLVVEMKNQLVLGRVQPGESMDLLTEPTVAGCKLCTDTN